MSTRVEDRRFTDKSDLDPGAVRSLPVNHPALTENRSLFPSTVVTVDENFSEHILVSGKNNRKLGECIQRGKFKGYALYGLSLEERATCPETCSVRGFCYGNGMQMARRHKIGDLDLFFTFIEDEVRTILASGVGGLMIRLHVLGDFPSVDYVAQWAHMLDQHPKLACYGYTHRLPKKPGGDEIGDMIATLKKRYPDRFRIRWSSDKPIADGAVVIDRIPKSKRVPEGIVCPAQTEATACCASCGLCWEGHARSETIVFIKHGPKSLQAALDSSGNGHELSEKIRPVTGMNIPQKRNAVLSAPPKARMVKPTDLKIEAAYQRDLSAKSMGLIRKIVTEWNWAKFKPPVCAETKDGLFVIDGQHTAIAAASHPEIAQIPVMVVPADKLESRAEAFVSHNRDRITMSPLQVFHAELASGNQSARDILKAAVVAGVTIPRSVPLKGYAKPHQAIAVTALRRVSQSGGAETLTRVLKIAAASNMTPINSTLVYALDLICRSPVFARAAAKHVCILDVLRRPQLSEALTLCVARIAPLWRARLHEQETLIASLPGRGMVIAPTGKSCVRSGYWWSDCRSNSEASLKWLRQAGLALYLSFLITAGVGAQSPAHGATTQVTLRPHHSAAESKAPSALKGVQVFDVSPQIYSECLFSHFDQVAFCNSPNGIQVYFFTRPDYRFGPYLGLFKVEIAWRSKLNLMDRSCTVSGCLSAIYDFDVRPQLIGKREILNKAASNHNISPQLSFGVTLASFQKPSSGPPQRQCEQHEKQGRECSESCVVLINENSDTIFMPSDRQREIGETFFKGLLGCVVLALLYTGLKRL